MADITPNMTLNKKRLAIEISAMLLNIERLGLRALELEVEKQTVAENVAASNKRIVEIQEQLKILGD